jgi:hypothetical protein
MVKTFDPVKPAVEVLQKMKAAPLKKIRVPPDFLRATDHEILC